MMSPITIELMAEEKEARFLREAERIRLLNTARGSRPRLGARMFSKMGDGFIAAGRWLKSRSRPEVSVDMNPCPACNGNACA